MRAGLPSAALVNHPARVLYGVYAARMITALAIYGAALLVGQDWLRAGQLFPDLSLRALVLGSLAAVGAFTAVSYWWSHQIQGDDLSPRFIYVQAAFDILLITGIVFLTGGSLSVLPPLLYIGLVSGYALITSMAGGAVIALATSVAYLAMISIAFPEQVGVPVVLQVVIFTLVALFSGFVGGRLRQVGSQLSTLERQLRRLRVGTSDILRAIDAAVVTLDAQGVCAYLNPAAARLFSLDPNRWIGAPILDELGRRAPGVALAARETIEGGPPVRNREIDVLDASGTPLPHGVSTATVERGGESPMIAVVLQDLRMARQLEELHLRASRLGVVAELASSLAHEIKNPLASIRSAIEQISEEDTDGEDRQMLTRLVIRETDRLSRLLGEFNDFARVGVAQRKLLDIDRIVTETLQLIRQRPEAEDRATFEVVIATELDDVWGDPDLIHRTLSNLILNAIQVGDPDQPVRVSVVADVMGKDLIPAEVAPGSPVRIRVIDDGPGIAPEDLGRIFDPFYTRRQGGSGMGLAIAHRAVQAHGGALLVSSTPGHGATFAIILPRRDWQERQDLERKGWGEQVEELQRRHPHLSTNPADANTPALGELADRIQVSSGATARSSEPS